jgi:xanthine dehydrogenase/oxidase
MGDKCCRNKNNQGNVVNGNSEEVNEETLFNPDDFKPYDATQEPIFPPELQVPTNHIIINYLYLDCIYLINFIFFAVVT